MSDLKNQRLEKIKEKQKKELLEAEKGFDIKDEILNKVLKKTKEKINHDDISVVNALEETSTIFIKSDNYKLMSDILEVYMPEMVDRYYMKNYDAGLRSEKEFLNRFGSLESLKEAIKVIGFSVRSRFWEYNLRYELDLSFATNDYIFNLTFENYHFYKNDNFRRVPSGGKIRDSNGRYYDIFQYIVNDLYSIFVSDNSAISYCTYQDQYDKLLEIFIKKEV